MLDAFIIEELKRKERQREQEAERPRPQLPIPSSPSRSPDGAGEEDDHPRQSDDGKPQRGVVIIDYSV